ncbi:MAG: hypothetical protein QOH01_3247 [Verrucomicrobiota bacterium]|jgi:hypothetical protein
MSKPKLSPFSLFLGAIFGWLALILEFAVWGFVIPHPYPIGPEIGPVASFIVFSIILSVQFIIEFGIVAIPSQLFLRPLLGPFSSWVWGLVGAALFALSIPIWSILLLHMHFHDIVFLAVLALVPGFIAFAFPDWRCRVT